MERQARIESERIGNRLILRVPVSFRKHRGRKEIHAAGAGPEFAKPDHALLKAIARAHRWRDMLDSGKFKTVRHLARAERISETYLARVVRMTLLSPKLVEAVLAGKPPAGLSLKTALEPFPLDWSEQDNWFA
ncbi:hypothetical protein [Hyphobacterium sp.]|uniref:hypothetical protein n=1 Tax=Hyphobacterium sp. TaxID=2004662 RepID=UPI003BACC6E7